MVLRNALLNCVVGAVCLVVVNAAACLKSRETCPGVCRGSPNVVLDLSCGGTDLTSVILSGACNNGDASAPDIYLGGPQQQYVVLPSDDVGDCHVELVFANGFRFTTEVHFTMQTDNSDPQCPCGYVQADQQTIAVNNPSSTCVDASPPEPPPVPETLATRLSGAIGLAVDSTYAYVAVESDGYVMKVAKGGGTPINLANSASPTGIAVDSAGVYFTAYTNAGEVLELTTGSVAITTLATAQSYPSGIAVGSSTAYWTNSANGAANLGSIVKLSVSGGTPTTLASAQNFPNGIAVDATRVYWANWGLTADNGAIMSVPIGGGSATTLASGQGRPQGIAVDGTSVYWTNSGAPGSVVKVPIGGGTSTTLASGQSAPAFLALDGANVYWTNYGTTGLSDGAVMKVALGGGTPITLASGQANPTGIAIDATSVYWLTAGNPGTSGGSLLKLTPK